MSKRKNTFLEGAVLPSLLKFALPVLLALILQALYGAVDLWAVGKFGTTADISAVSTGSQTMQIVTGMVTGLSMGTTVLLGKCIGQKDDEGAASAVGTSIKVFGVLGIALSIIMVASAKPIAHIMNAPEEAFKETVSYIRICGGGSLCIVAYNLLSAVFRGLGDSKSPLIFVSIASVINIVGDVTLIKIFKLGASGAAAATVAAQALSVVLSYCLIKKKGLPFHFTDRHLDYKKDTAKSVIRLGAPIALQDMCNELSYLIIIGLVNTLGVTASAGVGIAEKLVIFILLIPTAYMQSISAFTAQNAGAEKYERGEKAMWAGMATAAVLGGIIACTVCFHGGALSSIFINKSADERNAVIHNAAEFLKATSIECFVLSVAYCLTGYFNGLGKTRFVMLQGLMAIFLVKIPYAYYESRQPEPGLFRIGLSTAYAALFTLLASLLYYIHLKKQKKETPVEDE